MKRLTLTLAVLAALGADDCDTGAEVRAQRIAWIWQEIGHCKSLGGVPIIDRASDGQPWALLNCAFPCPQPALPPAGVER